MSPFHVIDFEAYFAPTSQSRMSTNFRDLESLGESAGKKEGGGWGKLPIFFCEFLTGVRPTTNYFSERGRGVRP